MWSWSWHGVVTWRIIPASKWLITMVIVSPLRIGLFPLQNGRFMAKKNGGDPKYFGMILQVRTAKMVGVFNLPWWSCDMASGFGCILSLELWNEAAAESSQCLLHAWNWGEREICGKTLLDIVTLKTWHPKGEHLHVFGEKNGGIGGMIKNALNI